MRERKLKRVLMNKYVVFMCTLEFQIDGVVGIKGAARNMLIFITIFSNEMLCPPNGHSLH